MFSKMRQRITSLVRSARASHLRLIYGFFKALGFTVFSRSLYRIVFCVGFTIAIRSLSILFCLTILGHPNDPCNHISQWEITSG